MYVYRSLQEALFSGIQTESLPSNYYIGGSTESPIKLLHRWQHLHNDLLYVTPWCMYTVWLNTDILRQTSYNGVSLYEKTCRNIRY